MREGKDVKRRVTTYLKILMAGVMLLLGMMMIPKNVRASDLSKFTNTLQPLAIYGECSNTYLEKTENGWQAVLADGDTVHIIEFNDSWEQKSEKLLQYELPLFGGYFSGEKYNFLIFGQRGETDGAEIYRIVKYNKDFQRLQALSIPYENCYTKIPFDGGNGCIAENGNELTFYTSKLRPDGHQSNMLIQINSDNMTIINEEDLRSQFQDVHVGHSFRQYVEYDGDMPVFADLGDAYPRAVCLQTDSAGMIEIMSIEGEIGDNRTNTELSGLKVTDTGYLMVGSQIKNGVLNIFLSYTEKGKTDAEITWLTEDGVFDFSEMSNAKIVKLNEGMYAVMWNCTDFSSKVNYVITDSQGNIISELKTMEGAQLTNCEPVLADGKLFWLRYTSGKLTVDSLTDFISYGQYNPEETYIVPVDPWNGTVDTSWYNDDIKEFVLTKPEQVAGLAKLVNEGNTLKGKKICLGKDMFFNSRTAEYSWIPIASTSSGIEFEGTFDGQGHKIYNVYVSPNSGGGLFGTIGAEGTVKGIQICFGYFKDGAAVAHTNKGKILFCENESNVDSGTRTRHTGGICDINENFVYGCGNSGLVQGWPYVGGIAGINSGDTSIIDSCWNEGAVLGLSDYAGGIVSDSKGYIYDSYNFGSVTGGWNTGGIAGKQENSQEEARLVNCYNAGEVVATHGKSDVICGYLSGVCSNTYSLDNEYNKYARILTEEQFKDPETVKLLQGDRVIQKWTEGDTDINNGYIIPTARKDIEVGIYKILPNVEGAIKEISISLSDSKYQLKAFASAFYGSEEAAAVYFSKNTDILSITPDGIVTPKKNGTAVVHVTFPESDYVKESGFDVTVNVYGMRGDVDDSGKVDIADLRLVLRAVCGKVELTDAQTSAADVETDGKVDIQDLRKILRFVCGKIETL